MRRFLTFDDVGLVPAFNNIKSRLEAQLHIKLGADMFKTPFIPANMESVIGTNLAKICKDRGAPIIFHRFGPINDQINWLKEFPDAYLSVGVKTDINILYKEGCRRFCIDVAHGHSQNVLDLIKIIKDLDKTNQIIAGNVCTYDGVIDLGRAGADIIKIGVGPGAACITRMMTGFGIPQFSAIKECHRAKLLLWRNDINVYLIADGGIKHPRDAVLALAAGADAVMMGSIFARTFESAAPKHMIEDTMYGRYRGQASTEFMDEYSLSKRQAEGVAFDVEINKSANDIFDEYEGGLRSALTYCGTNNIIDFKNTVEIFESTENYMKESNYRK